MTTVHSRENLQFVFLGDCLTKAPDSADAETGFLEALPQMRFHHLSAHHRTKFFHDSLLEACTTKDGMYFSDWDDFDTSMGEYYPGESQTWRTLHNKIVQVPLGYGCPTECETFIHWNDPQNHGELCGFEVVSLNCSDLKLDPKEIQKTLTKCPPRRISAWSKFQILHLTASYNRARKPDPESFVPENFELVSSAVHPLEDKVSLVAFQSNSLFVKATKVEPSFDLGLVMPALVTQVRPRSETTYELYQMRRSSELSAKK